MHTSIYNFETEKVIWKKVDPAVDSDYEFTPFQATVADGTNPAIAAYDENVAIVYHHEGQIKCVYSSDDGDSWSTPVLVDDGEYPDCFAVGDIIYAVYVNDDNLYLVSSEDGGASWSSPEMVNDEEGSVVAEENCCDVHTGGIVWVDDRNGEYNIYYAQFLSPGEPPNAPTISGQTSGDVDTAYEYTFSATDPDGDAIAEFIIEWGDGAQDTLTGPSPASMFHTYTVAGDYVITAKAKDATGLIGPEGTLSIKMPRSRTINPFLARFFDNHPYLFALLQQLFGL